MNLYTNSLLPHAIRLVIIFMAIVSTFIEPCCRFIGLFIAELLLRNCYYMEDINCYYMEDINVTWKTLMRIVECV